MAAHMDHHSILDRSSASRGVEGDTPGASASRSATASVSAGIAAANAHPTKSAEPGPRFPGEDGGRSLAEMAYLDLDAALQLLVERANYITAASGAAIALRRGAHNDMLCRASAGSNAPQLGSLLSMEYGLSGECVRTRQVLRCDDAERDPRVNREVCHDLGIASVVVMPIVSDEQVLGVFELLSGKTRAFDERDLSALQRLSEMVETAVKHAAAAQVVPAVQELDLAESEPPVEVIAAATMQVESSSDVIEPKFVPAPTSPVKDLLPQESEKTGPEETKPQPEPKRPLFWSAALRAQGSTAQAEAVAESITVPPGLRNLQKCQACGFPVSQGRTFCVECEEKQWRNPHPPQHAVGAAAVTLVPQPAREDKGRQEPTVVRATPDAPEILASKNSSSRPIPLSQLAKIQVAKTQAANSTKISAQASVETGEPAETELATPAPGDVRKTDLQVNVTESVPGSDGSAPFLSSALPAESWFAANKYILGALLVVAIVLGAIAWLR